MSLQVRPAPVEPDRPAHDRAERVADRAGQGDRHVGPGGRVDLVAEDGDVGAGERPGRDRASVDHHELARGGQDRVDEHEEEHGVEAVVPDDAGDGLGDRVHRRDSTRGRRSENAHRLSQLDGAELVPSGDADRE